MKVAMAQIPVNVILVLVIVIYFAMHYVNIILFVIVMIVGKHHSMGFVYQAVDVLCVFTIGIAMIQQHAIVVKIAIQCILPHFARIGRKMK